MEPTSFSISLLISFSTSPDMGTAGSASGSGAASATGSGTNGVAGVGAQDTEHLTLLTGQATQTNATSALTTAK